MHVGDLVDPPLTQREMQDIAYAAKMAFAKTMRARRRKSRTRGQGNAAAPEREPSGEGEEKGESK